MCVRSCLLLLFLLSSRIYTVCHCRLSCVRVRVVVHCCTAPHRQMRSDVEGKLDEASTNEESVREETSKLNETFGTLWSHHLLQERATRVEEQGKLQVLRKGVATALTRARQEEQMARQATVDVLDLQLAIANLLTVSAADPSADVDLDNTTSLLSRALEATDTLEGEVKSLETARANALQVLNEQLKVGKGIGKRRLESNEALHEKLRDHTTPMLTVV